MSEPAEPPIVESSDSEARQDGPACWIVGFDGSPHASRALEWAAHRAAEQGVLLDIVSAWMYPHSESIPPMHEEEGPSEDGSPEMVYSVEQLSDRFGVESRRRAVIGPASEVLLDAVENADLTVVGSRGRGGLARLFLGSVSHNLVNGSRRPTIVVPESTDLTDRLPLRRVVVGVDRSGGSFAALRWAHEFAPPDCEVVALNIWHGFGNAGAEIDAMTTARLRQSAQEDLEQMLNKLEAELGAPGRFTRVFETGHPGKTLVRFGASSDLVVVGTRGETSSEGPILGSVAMWLVHNLPCPTAVIPAPSADG